MSFDALLIAGPTAVGKTAFVPDIAEALGGTIINADSMQVYEGLHILTARPGAGEIVRVPHRLFGVRDPARPWSAGDWNEAVRDVLGETLGEGRLPILVGGTGLYLRVALEGIAGTPDIPPGVRKQVQAITAAEGAEGLHKRLAQEDPVMAGRLKPGDTQRQQRALGVIRATGRSLACWQEEAGAPGALQELEDAGKVEKIVLIRKRKTLYARVEDRVDEMFEEGGVEEAQALLARDLPPKAPVMKALGVQEIAMYLAGDISPEQAKERLKTRSRRYAKRQLTWLRNQCPDWPRLDLDDQVAVSRYKRTLIDRYRKGQPS